jgi:hypothetical protein
VKIDDIVKVKVSYPKEYKKGKYLKDGSVHSVHKLMAEDLVSKGIVKIID